MQKSPQGMREQVGCREITEISGKDSMNNGWNAPWVSRMSRNGAAAASPASGTASARRPPTQQITASPSSPLPSPPPAGFYAEEHCGRGLTRFWDRNWRKGGLYERRNILARQFYNQQYCGCEFSLRRLTE